MFWIRKGIVEIRKQIQHRVGQRSGDWAARAVVVAAYLIGPGADRGPSALRRGYKS